MRLEPSTQRCATRNSMGQICNRSFAYRVTVGSEESVICGPCINWFAEQWNTANTEVKAHEHRARVLANAGFREMEEES
jgi:hypothetical protein